MEPYIYHLAIKDSHKTAKQKIGLQKNRVDQLNVNIEGCEGDYNEYRTRHKQSTNDRAVSIITKQILHDLTTEGWGPVMPGDLGENITLGGEITIEIGQRYSIGTVVLEITEEIEPCNKLQFLPYVGREKRVNFIQTLKKRRGYYAKVLLEGYIVPGDKVVQIN